MTEQLVYGVDFSVRKGRFRVDFGAKLKSKKSVRCHKCNMKRVDLKNRNLKKET